MPISYQYKTIFIHIPKCAGTSIEKMLGMATKGEFFSYGRVYLNDFTKVPKERFEINDYIECMVKTPQHQKLIDLKKIIPKGVFDSYFKFTVVRNPFTRLVSEFQYIQENKNHFGMTNLSNLIECLECDRFKRICRFDGHLETQTSFLLNENGNIDDSLKIYKFEKIQECFDDLSEIVATNPSHSRKNKYSIPCSEYYTDELADKVRKFYKEDFTNFNYSTEVPA